ncbi:MAG: glycosyltransferase [Geobacteraceae bacterium]|nr:glycosyltransferase [Geobacteraceae bacterium]
MIRQIIYFSRFHNNPSSHGGDKRAAQLCDILNLLEYDFVSTCDSSFDISAELNKLLLSPSGYFQKKRSTHNKNEVTYSKYFLWSEDFRNHLLYLHLQAKCFVESLKNPPKMLFVDDPVFFAPVVLYAKSKGIPLVAFCHNIETLSREQVDPSTQRELFAYEIELISKCDLVVTISQEETYLLRNFGFDPVYLPYFPSPQTNRRLEAIREIRDATIKTNYLILGTVYNMPTLEGMKRVLDTISTDKAFTDDSFIVVGYGTEQLSSYLNDPRVEVRGAVPDAELDDLMAVAKGCIVYQDTGSGALTKIPELLVAGVPVIINSHAARSYHNLPGIFEFEYFDGLATQMELASNCNVFKHILTPPDTTALKKRIIDLTPSNPPSPGV